MMTLAEQLIHLAVERDALKAEVERLRGAIKAISWTLPEDLKVAGYSYSAKKVATLLEVAGIRVAPSSQEPTPDEAGNQACPPAGSRLE